MFRDANALAHGARLQYDLCIVGGGAAGIAIARRLRGLPIRTCLLESGGFEPDAETQALYAGTSTAGGVMDDGYLTRSRLRYFGGSTNHWDSWCAPFDAEDFEARPWVPHSGWPLSPADLEPYYRDAQGLCDLGPYDYDVTRWLGEDRRTPPFSNGAFVTRLWQKSGTPVRFGARYREDLAQADGLDVYLRANATNLELTADRGRILRAEAATLAGRRFGVEARLFVLACGGFENPRLLLLSDGVDQRGVGNAHDLVGRFYMDHPHPPSIGTGVLADEAAARTLDPKRTPFADGALLVVPNFGPSAAVQRREGLLSGSFRLIDLPEQAQAPHAGAVARELAFVAGSDPRRARVRRLVGVLEQSPNPESRVTLGEQRDALGLRRLHFDWRFNAIDRESLLRTCRLLAAELGRSGMGRIRLVDWLRDGSVWPGDVVRGGSHHLGTTRMSASPRAGVVDADCRVHGVANLYVAGSSVFPTSSRVNPTLTLVALALRLADHLRARELA